MLSNDKLEITVESFYEWYRPKSTNKSPINNITDQIWYKTYVIIKSYPKTPRAKQEYPSVGIKEDQLY